MEILTLILQGLPLVLVLVYVSAACWTKDDVKEIKYLLWAGLFLLASITDAII